MRKTLPIVILASVFMSLAAAHVNAAEAETRVNGFAKLVKTSDQDNYFTTHRGTVTDVAYAWSKRPPQFVVWMTEPVPENPAARVVFAFDVQMSGKYQRRGWFMHVERPFPVDLLLNGKKIVTFRSALQGDARFSNAEEGKPATVDLFCDVIREDKHGDISGIMYLSVPASMVVPGQPAQLELQAHDAGAHAYTGVIMRGKTWEAAASIQDNPVEIPVPKALKLAMPISNTVGPVPSEQAKVELAKWEMRVVGAVGKTTFVNGLAQMLQAPGRSIYHSQRKTTQQAGWAFARGGETIVWATAPVPEDIATPLVTFAWDGNLTGGRSVHLEGKTGPFTFDLTVNDESILTFESAQVGDRRWKNAEKNVELFWDMTGHDGVLDLRGVFFLTVPTAMVTSGEPVTFSVTGADRQAKVFFMVCAHGDTVEYLASGQLVQNLDALPNPKVFTKEDFYYDGSGYMRVIDARGSDQWDNLDEYLTRGKFRTAGNELMERLIFRDAYTHNEKWLLTRLSGKHAYATILAWNANGELLQFDSFEHRSRLYNMLTAKPEKERPKLLGPWDRVHPYVMYCARGIKGGWGKSNEETVGEVLRINIRTGEIKKLADRQGHGG